VTNQGPNATEKGVTIGALECLNKIDSDFPNRAGSQNVLGKPKIERSKTNIPIKQEYNQIINEFC